MKGNEERKDRCASTRDQHVEVDSSVRCRVADSWRGLTLMPLKRCPSLGTPVAGPEVDTAVAGEPGPVWWRQWSRKVEGQWHLGQKREQVMERWRRPTPAIHRGVGGVFFSADASRSIGPRRGALEKLLTVMIQRGSHNEDTTTQCFTLKQRKNFSLPQRTVEIKLNKLVGSHKFFLKFGTLMRLRSATEATEGVMRGNTSPTFLTNRTIRT